MVELPNKIYVWPGNAKFFANKASLNNAYDESIRATPDKEGVYIEYYKSQEIGDLDFVLKLLQIGEISTGKAREYIEAWMNGDLKSSLEKDNR